jgi:PAS domain-containing protein
MDDLSGRPPGRPVAASPRGTRRRGLRTHLLAVVLAVLLPALALGGATAWQMGQNIRRASDERLTDTARALALALDAEIGAHIAALRALAASPDLEPGGNLDAFRILAEPALAGFGSWVVVSTVEDRRQLLNTALPPGAALPPPGPAVPAPLLEQAIATGQPTVLNLHRPPLMDRLSTGVVVPVIRDGAVIRLLGAPLLPERLSGILGGQDVAPPGFATLLDGNGRVIARSSGHQRFLGQPVPGWFMEATAGRERGLVEGTSLSGEPAVIAFQRLGSAPSWTLALGMPAAAHRAGWQAPLFWLAGGGLAAFGLALLLAAWLAQRILEPVRALVRRANTLAARGAVEGVVPRPVAIAEFEALREAGERAEAALRRRTAELRESEARFRAVFDSDLIGLGIFDVATNESVAINDAALRLMDATREEFESGLRDWAMATAPEHVARDLALVRQVRDGARRPDREGLRPHGRHPRCPCASASRRCPGSGPRVVSVEDLTGTRAARPRCARARRVPRADRPRTELHLVRHTRWELQYLTRPLARVHRPDAGAGAAGWLGGDAAPGGRGAHRLDLGEARAAGTVYEIEVRYSRHDGEYRWYLARAEPVRDAGGASPPGSAARPTSTTASWRRSARAAAAWELDHRARTRSPWCRRRCG